jgi:hypothetical protein
MGWALRRAVVPPRRPAKAAASARLLTVEVFMKSSFLGWSRRCPWKLSLTRYSWTETGVEVFFPRRTFEAWTNGWLQTSLQIRRGIVAAPTIAPCNLKRLHR